MLCDQAVIKDYNAVIGYKNNSSFNNSICELNR